MKEKMKRDKDKEVKDVFFKKCFRTVKPAR